MVEVGRPILVRRASVSAALFYTYLALALLSVLFDVSVFRRLLVVVGSVLLALECQGRGGAERPAVAWGVVLAIVAGMGLQFVAFGQTPKELVYLPGNVGMALAIVRRRVSANGCLAWATVVAAYFAVRLLTVPHPDDIQRILATGSANGISEVVLCLTVLAYLARHQEPDRPVILWPAGMCLAVLALCRGRAGLISGVLLLVGMAAVSLVRQTGSIRLLAKVVAYVLVAAVAAAAVLYRLDLLELALSRFTQLGLDSLRTKIWAEYIAGLTWFELVFGYPRERAFAGWTNVHSSFLFWHKSLGFMATPLYVATIVSTVAVIRRDAALAVAWIALLFRAAFDETLLPFRFYDFLFFVVLIVGRPWWTLPVVARLRRVLREGRPAKAGAVALGCAPRERRSPTRVAGGDGQAIPTTTCIAAARRVTQ